MYERARSWISYCELTRGLVSGSHSWWETSPRPFFFPLLMTCRSSSVYQIFRFRPLTPDQLRVVGGRGTGGLAFSVSAGTNSEKLPTTIKVNRSSVRVGIENRISISIEVHRYPKFGRGVRLRSAYAPTSSGVGTRIPFSPPCYLRAIFRPGGYQRVSWCKSEREL